jgi:uncharacterized membrane protein YphA (DoxX/SURF4 family)
MVTLLVAANRDCSIQLSKVIRWAAAGEIDSAGLFNLLASSADKGSDSFSERVNRRCSPRSIVIEAFCKDKLGPFVLRLALGLFCVYHGYVKIMANGGTTWNPSLTVGWQLLVAWGEFASGLAILLGFRCRLAAGTVLFLLIGLLIWTQGWHVWRLPVQSLETTALLFLTGMALLFVGAGELSLDQRGAGRAVRKK